MKQHGWVSNEGMEILSAGNKYCLSSNEGIEILLTGTQCLGFNEGIGILSTGKQRLFEFQ